MKYCAYQERCQQEVRNKLYDFGINKDEIEDLIAYLISENFLNEERFAKAYVRGKFYFKSWGRIKIKAHLKQKQVSDYCIKKGLEEIEEKDYISKLEELANKKASSIIENNSFLKKQKIGAYLNSKGYESDLIWSLLDDLFN